MTQVGFGTCVPDFAVRPDTRVPFIGSLTQMPPGPCEGNDPPRRDDGLKPHYGRGVPTISSAVVDIWGLAEGAAPLAQQTASTSSGPVLLPVDRDAAQYSPSVGTLDFLTHSQSTRLQPLPARFYR
jgi:hypothetical protein